MLEQVEEIRLEPEITLVKSAIRFFSVYEWLGGGGEEVFDSRSQTCPSSDSRGVSEHVLNLLH